MSSISNTADSAARGLVSHPVNDLETPGTTPQSGSPTSENGSNYSPISQPFAERPPVRTSAGAAVRQSISNLPSPPPFTPSSPVGLVGPVNSPAPFSMAYSGASCNSIEPAAGVDTPGVTSAWQHSSTKGATSEGTFAFNTPRAAGVTSPDGQMFASVAAAPGTDLLLQAAQNMAAAHDADATSESSSVSRASRSSSSWRDSHGGVSPADLLRKAKVVIERQAAIEGTSRLSRGKSKKGNNPLQTPLDKSIQLAITPQNTPMDVESGQLEDQQASLAATPVSVVAPVMIATPASTTPTSKLAAVETVVETAVETTVAADKGSPVQLSARASPADSHASEISIGSVCPTPVSVVREGDDSARRLNFDDDAANDTPAAVQSIGPLVGANMHTEDLPDSPTPMEQLISEMQCETTKKFFAKNRLIAEEDILDDFTFAVPHTPSAGTEVVAETAAAKQALFNAEDQEPPTAMPTRSSIASRIGRGLMLGITGLALVFVALLAVEFLPSPLQHGPGVWCTVHNMPACVKLSGYASSKMDQDVQLSGWKLLIKRTSWYVRDAHNIFIQRKLPEGITKDDAVLHLLASYSEQQLQDMPVEQAVQYFADASRHRLPQVIQAKLDTAEATALLHKQLQQMPPEDLTAMSGSGATPVADVQSQQPAAEEPSAEPDSTDMTVHIADDNAASAPAKPAMESAVAAEPTDGASLAEEQISAEMPAAEAVTGQLSDGARDFVMQVPFEEGVQQEEQSPAPSDDQHSPVEPEPAAEVSLIPSETALEQPAGTGHSEAIIQAVDLQQEEQVAAPASSKPPAEELLTALEAAASDSTAEQITGAPSGKETVAELPTAAEQTEEPEAAVQEAEQQTAPQEQTADEQILEDDVVSEITLEQWQQLEPEEQQQAHEQQQKPAEQLLNMVQDQGQDTTQKAETPILQPDMLATSEEGEQPTMQAQADSTSAAVAAGLLSLKMFQVMSAVVALGAVAAMLLSLSAVKAVLLGEQQPAQQEAQTGDGALDMQQEEITAVAAAVAATPAALRTPSLAAAAATAATPGPADAGVLSDEEGEMQPESVMKQEQEGLAAGFIKAFTPVAKPPLPPAAAAAVAASGPVAGATGATAEGRTPKAAKSGSIGAAINRMRTRSSQMTTAAEVEEGEEVQQPASTGRRRAAATPRGRKSMAPLQPVPEQQQADVHDDDANAGILSDEEPAPRARNRRHSAPIAGGASGTTRATGSRARKSAAAADSAAAAAADTTPGPARRSARRSNSQL